MTSTAEVLSKMREKLVHQLVELGAGESGDLRSDMVFGGSFADAGAATAERTEVLLLLDQIMVQIEEVDQALLGVKNGTYGTCVRCGKKISNARLEARPESTRCVECKASLH